MVIAEMLGVEDGDMAAFKSWSDAIFSNIGDILFAEPSEGGSGQRGDERLFS